MDCVPDIATFQNNKSKLLVKPNIFYSSFFNYLVNFCSECGEQLAAGIQLNIESKTVSIVQKTLNVLREEEGTAATFRPLDPFSKLIGKGVTQIVEDIAKRRKL